MSEDAAKRLRKRREEILSRTTREEWVAQTQKFLDKLTKFAEENFPRREKKKLKLNWFDKILEQLLYSKLFNKVRQKHYSEAYSQGRFDYKMYCEQR